MWGDFRDDTSYTVNRHHHPDHRASISQRRPDTGPGDAELVECLLAVLTDNAGIVDRRCLPSRSENLLSGGSFDSKILQQSAVRPLNHLCESDPTARLIGCTDKK